MWRYLILNTLWFSMLFLVNFYGTRLSRLFVLTLIFAAAAYTAACTTVDPLAWLFYLLFSLCVFAGARQFKRWVYARLVVLDEEVTALSKQLKTEAAAVAAKTEVTEALKRRADEIAHLYDKVKEMSKSLDMLETFLIFAEAVAGNFKFHSVKLALFEEDDTDGERPLSMLHVPYEAFHGAVFDKSEYLQNRAKAYAETAAVELKICRIIFKNKKPIVAAGAKSALLDEFELGADFAPFMAHPVFIHKKIFAVLILLGVRSKEVPLLSILTEQFIAEIQRVKLYERVEMLAITDGLTGVVVRRHLLERLDGELARSQRFGFKLSFLMIDVDFFKHFNDEYGHLVGDVVLKQVAETIKKNIREVDLVGRYGGEEFGVLLTETDESAAFLVAERIRRSIEERTFTAYDEHLKVTISLGCATTSADIRDARPLLEAADAALYQAKRQGRNRVSLSSLPEV